ncbi:MAG TPA: choice-of-anchor D domain-containing protein, partial [Geobacteraceae bacterium]|nr:choice-of-anchor D domain-containing protein [Geobacteraceae bacterium]
EGGGVHLAGELVPFGADTFTPPQVLTFGAGPIAFYDNLVHGNKGGDDGGGIRTLDYNGEDVRLNPGNQALPKLATVTADAVPGDTTISVQPPLLVALNPGDIAYVVGTEGPTDPPTIVTVAAPPAGSPCNSVGATCITVTPLVDFEAVGETVPEPGALAPAGTVLDFRKNQWNELDIFNNIIVDNSSADHGGGLSFDNTVNSFVVSNTIANNDATATAPGAFSLAQCTSDDAEGQFCPNISPQENGGTGGQSVSAPQVGGIASFAHGSDLLFYVLQPSVPYAFCTLNPASNLCSRFSNPVLQNDIIWHNRSFYWDPRINLGLGGLIPIPVRNGYWDMTVYGLAGLPVNQRLLNPTYSLLTDGVGGSGAVTNLLGTVGADPGFVTKCDQPFLGSQCQGFNQYQVAMKGGTLGNFVQTMYTPNGLRGDYHTGAGSSALDTGALFAGSTSPSFLLTDFDGKPRPLGMAADIGANEQFAASASFPILWVLHPIPPPPPALPILDFGKESLYRPGQKSVQIINYGQQNLIVAGVQITGPNASAFSAINWTGMTTLAPGSTMTLAVAFTPTTMADQTATLTIVSNATQNQTATVALKGSGF